MEYLNGFKNEFGQTLEYRKETGTDQAWFVMRCAYCDEQYPAQGDLDPVQCPVCDHGTPRVVFSESEFVYASVIEAADMVSLLGNERKIERERSICAAFLRCLGIDFELNEVTASLHEPSDVSFRAARFQIREMLPPERKPHREWKAELEARRKAATFEEMLKRRKQRNFTPPKYVSRRELLPIVCDALKEKQIRYNKMFLEGCTGIDALVYVNWTSFLDVESETPLLNELKNQQWRSVSLLFVPRAEILFASDDAPGFIRERQGRVESRWRRPGLFSV